MAIKNTLLGGVDWLENTNALRPIDLKDTFEKLIELIEDGY